MRVDDEVSIGASQVNGGKRLLTFKNAEVDIIDALVYRERLYHSSTMQKSSTSSSTVRFKIISNSQTKWRPKIIEWFYKIVDHFELNRDIVAISLDILDRFLILSSEEGNLEGVKYQLAAMTSLFIAIKVNYTPNRVLRTSIITLEDYAKLSRGQFLAQDLVAMEAELLQSLDWRVNPVIPTDYLVELLSLLNNRSEDNCEICSCNGHLQHVLTILYEVARYFIEVSITSPELHFYLDFFQVQSPSILCLGAIIQSLDWVSNQHISSYLKNDFFIRSLFLLHIDSPEIIDRVKKIIRSSFMPADISDGRITSLEAMREEVESFHPFVLLRNANVLCLSAQQSFISELSYQFNKKRKREYHHSPISTVD